MVSATCPLCRIILVEANSPTMQDLGTAVNSAVSLGAKYVSNSYGGPEDGSDPTSDASFLHIGTAETTTTTQFDKLTVTANGTTPATFSNLNHATGYQQHSYSLNGFAGQTVTLKFTGTEDSSLQTSFVVDDTAVNAS